MEKPCCRLKAPILGTSDDCSAGFSKLMTGLADKPKINIQRIIFCKQVIDTDPLRIDLQPAQSINIIHFIQLIPYLLETGVSDQPFHNFFPALLWQHPVLSFNPFITCLVISCPQKHTSHLSNGCGSFLLIVSFTL